MERRVRRPNGWMVGLLILVGVFSEMTEPMTGLAADSPAASDRAVRIHYRRADQSYDRWGLWLWDDVQQPSANWPAGAQPWGGRDGFGVWAEVRLATNPRKIGLMVIDRLTGDKDGGNKGVSIGMDVRDFYLRENDDRVYGSPAFEVTPELRAAAITASRTLTLTIADGAAVSAASLPADVTITDVHGRGVPVIAATAAGSDTFRLDVQFALTDAPLAVSYRDRTVAAPLAWRLVDELAAYDGDDLGCILRGGEAQLALWAPLATAVELLVFDREDQTRLLGRMPLTRTDRGVWRVVFTVADLRRMRGHPPATGAIPLGPRDPAPPRGPHETSELAGFYYQFEVSNPGRPPKRILDPYARSMAPVTVGPDGAPGASGDPVGKAAFVDPDSCGRRPAPFQLAGFTRREDAIIYEVHIRDFTSDPAIAGALTARFGTFRAFKDRLPYLRSLGVTHVQLLPVMAWYFGDETRMHERELHWSAKHNQYNWGYDPHSYFSLDGAYSEHPDDAGARIAEFKDLVDAIHAAGMGVILDVVYTHMANGSFLDDIVPDYFFFKDPQGNLLGDFGNNLATNRRMAAKLMVDSVRFWFSQYRIDGLRWDMMGDATREAVQQCYDAARAINPQAIFIGEGWRTFKGHLEDPALRGHGADQDWMADTDSVGVFSDEFRNELKSGFGSEGEPMFLTGGPRDVARLFAAIKAQPSNTPARSPGAMVQYIEAHDNLTLHDVIAQAIRKDPAIPANEREIHRRIRLGNAILLTAQGTAFIHAGQEWGRTKQWLGEGKPEQKYHEFHDAAGQPFRHPFFIHDSYDASDAVNRFDWAKATDPASYPEHAMTREFTRGLIALRRSSDAFRLETRALVDQNVALITAPEILPRDLVIAWRCTATTGETFRIFVNADDRPRAITPPNADFPEGHAVVVDATRAGTDALQDPAGFTLDRGRLVIEPLTAVVFRQ